MRLPYHIILFLLCMCTSSLAQLKKDGPILTFKEATIVDTVFYNTQNNGSKKYDFDFKNTGNKPLTIEFTPGSDPDFNCYYPKESIAPGKTGIVSICFPNVAVANKTKTYHIVSNSIVPASVTVKRIVKMLPAPKLKLKHQTVTLDSLNTTYLRAVYPITNIGKDTITLQLRVSFDWAAYRFPPKLAPGKTDSIVFTTDLRNRPFASYGQFAIETSDYRVSSISCYLNYNMKKALLDSLITAINNKVPQTVKEPLDNKAKTETTQPKISQHDKSIERFKKFVFSQLVVNNMQFESLRTFDYNTIQQMRLFYDYGDFDSPSPYAFYLVKIDTLGKLHFTEKGQSKYVKWDNFENTLKTIIERSPTWYPIPKDTLNYIFALNLDSLFNPSKVSFYKNIFVSNPIFYEKDHHIYSEFVSFPGFEPKPKAVIGDTLAKFVHLPAHVCDTTIYSLILLTDVIDDITVYNKKRDSLKLVDPGFAKYLIKTQYTYVGCPSYEIQYTKRGDKFKLHAIGNYDEKKRKHGYWRYFDSNGKMAMEGVYNHYIQVPVKINSGGYEGYYLGYKEKGKLVGTWKYYADGVLSREVAYDEKNNTISKWSFYEDGKLSKVEIHTKTKKNTEITNVYQKALIQKPTIVQKEKPVLKPTIVKKPFNTSMLYFLPRNQINFGKIDSTQTEIARTIKFVNSSDDTVSILGIWLDTSFCKCLPERKQLFPLDTLNLTIQCNNPKGDSMNIIEFRNNPITIQTSRGIYSLMYSITFQVKDTLDAISYWGLRGSRLNNFRKLYIPQYKEYRYFNLYNLQDTNYIPLILKNVPNASFMSSSFCKEVKVDYAIQEDTDQQTSYNFYKNNLLVKKYSNYHIGKLPFSKRRYKLRLLTEQILFSENGKQVKTIKTIRQQRKKIIVRKHGYKDKDGNLHIRKTRKRVVASRTIIKTNENGKRKKQKTKWAEIIRHAPF